MESVEFLLVKEFYQNVTTFLVEPVVKGIPEGVDRDFYLAMKQCKGCVSTFDKHDNKKYYCHFCYHAFCEKCCFLQVEHPESQKTERACAVCYLAYTKDSVLKVSEEFVQVKLKLQIEEKKKEEEKNIKVRQDIEGLKKIMKDEERIGLEELEKLELEIKDEDGKIRGKELAIQQMRAKLETPGGMSKDVRSTSSSRTGCMDCAIF
jgi:hypothetical protein